MEELEIPTLTIGTAEQHTLSLYPAVKDYPGGRPSILLDAQSFDLVRPRKGKDKPTFNDRPVEVESFAGGCGSRLTVEVGTSERHELCVEYGEFPFVGAHLLRSGCFTVYDNGEKIYEDPTPSRREFVVAFFRALLFFFI
jgi:hypothetical protein